MSFIFPSMQQETITPNCLESVSTAVETDNMSDTSDYVPTSPTYGPNTPTCSEMNVCYCFLSDAGHAPPARTSFSSPTSPRYSPGNGTDDTGITYVQDLDHTIHCLNFFNRLSTSNLELLASKITKLLEMSEQPIEQGKTI